MKNWQPWTAEQDAILMEHGNDGAEECARAIKRLFGIDRSADAVRRHAYRIGASIIEYQICVSCGAKTRRLTAEGICRACHTRRLSEKMRQRNDAVERQISRSEADSRSAERDFAKERQRTHRNKKARGNA